MDDVDGIWPGRRVAARGTSLFLRDSGGDAPTLVFLHGLGGHADEWWPVASRLAGKFRAVAFDQRGQGRSTLHPHDLSREAFVQDAVRVLEGLGQGPVLLVGQSMGAHTAFLVAARRPDLVHRLVLVEGGPGGEGTAASHEVADWFRGWPAPFASVAQAQAWFRGQGYGEDAAEAWAAGLEQTPAGLVPRFDPDVLLAQLLAVHEQDRLDEFATITCPVLLVTGPHGFIPDADTARLLTANPRASHIEVAGAGHDVHLDAPAELARLVEDFAASEDGRRGILPA